MLTLTNFDERIEEKKEDLDNSLSNSFSSCGLTMEKYQ
jgi:hypothetical protein